MSKTTNPYELLVRWDSDTGLIKGCHVKMITTHIDDETKEIIAVKESDAMPVAWAQDNGFPLDQVLQVIHIDALVTAQAESKEKIALIAEIETLKAKVSERDAEIESIKTSAIELATIPNG